MAQSRTQRTNRRLKDGAQKDELDTETDAEKIAIQFELQELQ